MTCPPKSGPDFGGQVRLLASMANTAFSRQLSSVAKETTILLLHHTQYLPRNPLKPPGYLSLTASMQITRPGKTHPGFSHPFRNPNSGYSPA